MNKKHYYIKKFRAYLEASGIKEIEETTIPHYLKLNSEGF
jgi:hypothetical protein